MSSILPLFRQMTSFDNNGKGLQEQTELGAAIKDRLWLQRVPGTQQSTFLTPTPSPWPLPRPPLPQINGGSKFQLDVLASE